MRKRVLLAGLFHETHTFLESVTLLSDFQIRRGAELLNARGDGSPLAGMLEVADECGWELIPVIDLRATPSGLVEDSVLELFLQELRAVGAPLLAKGLVDGICLILHGAMVTQSVRDVEGEVIRFLRSLPGGCSVPVCGVLDLHGNLSRETIEGTQGLIAYQSNPHTDACAAAAKGARLLDRILTDGAWPASLWQPTSILWPPTGTGTADEPMRTLEAMARRMEADHPEMVAINVFAGFSFADTRDTGVSFSAVTFGDLEPARNALRQLAAYTESHRTEGSRIDPALEEVLPAVRAAIAAGRTPVVLVEPSDNIGGGAPGDTTTILQMLLEQQPGRAVVVINDPAAVERLQSLETGESRTLTFGAEQSRAFCSPVTAEVTLLSRSDGRFELEDRHSHLASMCGTRIDMGTCAVVRAGPVHVLLTSKKTPPFDLGQLRSQGLEPAEFDILVVKAAVAHRQAYDPITSVSFTVDTPGPCSSNLERFPWQHIRQWD